jgi:hypothetical protein
MSKTPSLQLLGALFSAVSYFASERLPHFEIHQSTSENQNQHFHIRLHNADTQGKGCDLPSIRLRVPHYVSQPFVAGLNT